MLTKNHRVAFVRPPPGSSFQNCVTEHHAGGGNINVQLAMEQWRTYVKTIHDIVDQVVEVSLPDWNFFRTDESKLPTNESHPDCCFVEDTCLMVGNRVLALHLGHPSRRGEVAAIRDAFKDLQVCRDPHSVIHHS